MRFKRYERYEFRDTSRKRAAFGRKQRIERESMPLFADQIEADQISADEEMVKRRERCIRQTLTDRQSRANDWRRARNRAGDYPEPIRRALLVYWQRCMWPADPTYLLSMLHMYDTGRLELPDSL
jgi:hypothetical protein